jgi:hypothetical protein
MEGSLFFLRHVKDLPWMDFSDPQGPALSLLSGVCSDVTSPKMASSATIVKAANHEFCLVFLRSVKCTLWTFIYLEIYYAY